jgi:hypothetical protein
MVPAKYHIHIPRTKLIQKLSLIVMLLLQKLAFIRLLFLQKLSLIRIQLLYELSFFVPTVRLSPALGGGRPPGPRRGDGERKG